MVELMGSRQFPGGDVVTTVSSARRLFFTGVTLMSRLVPFAGMRRGIMAGGVVTTGGGARMGGGVGGFRRVFFGPGGCVRRVVRRRRNFLGNSRNRGDGSKTKQDEESPRSTRKLSKKAKTIERPWGSAAWHNQS